MRVLAESVDPVRLSFLAALLADAGIASQQLDTYVSGLHGGIGAFPRRLVVHPEDYNRALMVLRQAGEVTP